MIAQENTTTYYSAIKRAYGKEREHLVFVQVAADALKLIFAVVPYIGLDREKIDLRQAICWG